jgi:hypothetical protein
MGQEPGDRRLGVRVVARAVSRPNGIEDRALQVDQ